MVNQYYEAGLDRRISLTYIGTMKEGSKLRKLFTAVASYFRFVRLLGSCDIVHVNMASDASYIRKSFFIRAAYKKKKPVVLHQHGGDFEGYYASLSESGKKRVRDIFDMASVVLVLAPPWKQFFGRMTDPDKIIVFPDTVPLPPPAEKDYSGDSILFLGRLCREKGIGELLDAVRSLSGRYPGLKLFLGGIWEDQDLAAEAAALKEHCEWIGWVSGEKKQEYLRKASIFAMPSYFEGQSLSIMEAMASSCAVVASDTGGIPMMITDGENGLLVPVKDEKALEAALGRLLGDRDLCAELGKKARERIESDFSLDKNMDRLLEIYESLL
ncbi:MAG: glycosyltransferase family 4 protein [Lachnospiraceae bacterium]|nr:glycosyltransferase family 4 protein [Lachnospiraceae bacterium]